VKSKTLLFTNLVSTASEVRKLRSTKSAPNAFETGCTEPWPLYSYSEVSIATLNLTHHRLLRIHRLPDGLYQVRAVLCEHARHEACPPGPPRAPDPMQKVHCTRGKLGLQETGGQVAKKKLAGRTVVDMAHPISANI
jgi:hypothetical protein